MINFYIVTLFPEFFKSALETSLLGKAVDKKLVNIHYIHLRDFGTGNYRKVDDTPYGGGNGMVLMIEPLDKALQQAPAEAHRLLMTPRGRRLRQPDVQRFSQKTDLVIVCGHYEGIDERVAAHLVDEPVSIGDFVLSGGEPAALVLLDAVSRLQPGFMGNDSSIEDESFKSEGYIEYPQYTRPAEYKDMKVPDVLLSGNHAEIEKWRREQAEKAFRYFSEK